MRQLTLWLSLPKKITEPSAESTPAKSQRLKDWVWLSELLFLCHVLLVRNNPLILPKSISMHRLRYFDCAKTEFQKRELSNKQCYIIIHMIFFRLSAQTVLLWTYKEFNEKNDIKIIDTYIGCVISSNTKFDRIFIK